MTMNKDDRVMERESKKVFVVYNPKAGHADQLAEIRSMLESRFTVPQWDVEIYQTTGKEDLSAVCRDACKRGAALVISAGGDGTLVGVGNGLVNQSTPLGILPMGTGNDLARILKIPLKLDEALDLMVEDHQAIEIDALQVGDRYYFSNVSVGISPQVMDETKSEQKKRFGRLAYIWTMVKRSSIFQLRRYTLTVDGKSYRCRASEIMISNTTLLETLPHLFGPCETLNDGRLEIYVVSARTWRDYLKLLSDLLRHPGRSSAEFRHLEGQNHIRIELDRGTQLVQADGEVIGHTPLEVQLVTKALHVIMPKPEPESADEKRDVATTQVSVR